MFAGRIERTGMKTVDMEPGGTALTLVDAANLRMQASKHLTVYET